MKATIDINFLNIKDNDLSEDDKKKVKKSGEKMLKDICKALEKNFKSKGVKTEVFFILEVGEQKENDTE